MLDADAPVALRTDTEDLLDESPTRRLSLLLKSSAVEPTYARRAIHRASLPGQPRRGSVRGSTVLHGLAEVVPTSAVPPRPGSMTIADSVPLESSTRVGVRRASNAIAGKHARASTVYATHARAMQSPSARGSCIDGASRRGSSEFDAHAGSRYARLSKLIVDHHPTYEDAQVMALMASKRSVLYSRGGSSPALRAAASLPDVGLPASSSLCAIHQESVTVNVDQKPSKQVPLSDVTTDDHASHLSSTAHVDMPALDGSLVSHFSDDSSDTVGAREPHSVVAVPTLGVRQREDIAIRYAAFSDAEVESLISPNGGRSQNSSKPDLSVGAAGVVLPLLYPSNVLCWGALRHVLHDVGREYSQRISFYCLMFFIVVIVGELVVLSATILRSNTAADEGFLMLLVLAGFLLLTFGSSIAAQILQGARVNLATLRHQIRLNTIEALTYELLVSTPAAAIQLSTMLRARLQALRYVTNSVNERLKILDALEPARVMFIPARFALFGAMASLTGSLIALLINATRRLL
jgi:hypothetical protein